MAEGKIRFGASMYSYSSEYYIYRLSTDGILANIRDAGGEGVEIVAAQMVPGYPFPDREWLRGFRRKCESYGLEPFCYSAHLDSGLRSDRWLTPDEMVASTVNDIRCAYEMGASVVRTQQTVTPALIEKIAPWAEKYSVKVGVELHPPHRLSTPVWQEFLREFRRVGSGFVGVTLDLGIYQEFPYDGWISAYTSHGVTRETVGLILDGLRTGVPEEEVREKLARGGAGEYADEMLTEVYSLYAPYREDELGEILPYVTHFHSKFYHMVDGEEPTIPYRKILKILAEKGYEGYLISEYEGHYTYDASKVSCAGQIREHIAMEKRILAGLRGEKQE